MISNDRNVFKYENNEISKDGNVITYDENEIGNNDDVFRVYFIPWQTFLLVRAYFPLV